MKYGFRCLLALVGTVFFPTLISSEDYSKDLEKILATSEKLIQEELQNTPKICNASQLDDFSLLERSDIEAKICVFISISVPLESWKAHSKVLEKIGGSFVLKGMPKNSLKEFIKFVQSLKKKGINAPIKVDAADFENHQIKTVPSIVLTNRESSDKITGNIPIRNALEIFSSKGSLKEEAKQLLLSLDNSWDLR
jgi:type-F conjugative transfer system pilin assembly protein TrbC